MGNAYVMTSAVSGLTAVPFFQIATPSATKIEVLSINIGQGAGETSEQAVLTLSRRSFNSTFPVGNATSPRALSQNSKATELVAGTIQCAIGISTATGSLIDVLARRTFNVLNGLVYMPVPEERIISGPGGFLTGEFVVAPAANDYSVEITIREV